MKIKLESSKMHAPKHSIVLGARWETEPKRPLVSASQPDTSTLNKSSNNLMCLPLINLTQQQSSRCDGATTAVLLNTRARSSDENQRSYTTQCRRSKKCGNAGLKKHHLAPCREPCCAILKATLQQHCWSIYSSFWKIARAPTQRVVRSV